MDNFEKNIKDLVKDYQAPYDAKAWQTLNKKLGPSKLTKASIAAGIAAALVIGFVSYLGINHTDKKVITEKSEIVQSNQTSNKNNESIKTDEEQFEQEFVNTEDKAIEVIDVDIDKPIVISNGNVEEDAQNESETPELNKNNTPTNTTNELVEKVDNSNQKPNNIEENQVVIKLDAGFILSNNAVCQSESILLKAKNQNQNVVYEWHLGDGNVKTGHSINHIYQNAGTYTVELHLKSINSGELLKTSKSADVNILETPKAKFKYMDLQGVKPQTTFINESRNFVNCSWEIEDLYRTNLKDFNYSFIYKGDFNVNLTVEGENGCQSTVTQTINVEKDYNLLAPTAFSPNNDNLNDYFIPKALPILDLPFTMTIYDRQGRMVYQTSDANQPWDGLYTKDGIEAPAGIYVWVVQLTDENGNQEVYQDQITLTK